MFYAEDRNDPGVSDLLGAFEALLEGSSRFAFEERDIEQLIDYFEAAELYDRALEIAQMGTEHFPYSAELLLRRAGLVLARQDAVLALDLLDRAASLSPDSIDIGLLRAEALSYQGEYGAALEILDELACRADSGEEQADIHCVRSLVYEHQEDYDGMFGELREALDCAPDHQVAISRLGLAAEMTRRYEESRIILSALLEQDPYLYQAWYHLGEALEYMGHYEHALEAFEYAFIIQPDLEPAYRDFVELCFELKAYDKALSALEDMRAHLELDADMLLCSGKCHLFTGSFLSARRYFLQTLVLEPMHDEAFYLMGKSYAAEESWSMAAYYFQKALDVDEEMEEYLGALGEAFFRMDMLEAALRCFKRAIRLAPEEPAFWVHYATALLNAGRPADALEVLRESEEWTCSASLELASVACLYTLGRKRDALEKLERIRPENPEQFGTLFHILPELESDSDILALIAYLNMDLRSA